MADISSGGEADNVAASDQWVDEAIVERSLDTEGTERVRFVLGVLGISFSCTLPKGSSIQYLAFSGRDGLTGKPIKFHYAPTEDRLANEIRGNGD